MRWTSSRFAISCSALVLVAACGDPGPSGGSVASFGPAAPALVEVPRFTGHMDGHLVIVPPFQEGSDPACNANFSGDPEAPGPSITVLTEYDARFTHFGRSRLVAVTCLDPLSPQSSGTGFIEAANGDRVSIAFENTAFPPGPDPSVIRTAGPQWITGGTGRFAGASGTQACSFVGALSSPTTGTLEGECQGTLVFNASNASEGR